MTGGFHSPSVGNEDQTELLCESDEYSVLVWFFIAEINSKTKGDLRRKSVSGSVSGEHQGRNSGENSRWNCRSKAASWFAPHCLLSLFSYTTHSGQRPPTPIIDQESAMRTCLQANLLAPIPELRIPFLG